MKLKYFLFLGCFIVFHFNYAQEITKLNDEHNTSTNNLTTEDGRLEENNFQKQIQKDSAEIDSKAQKIKSFTANEKHDQIISSYYNDFLRKEQLNHFQLKYGIDTIDISSRERGTNPTKLTFSETKLPNQLTNSFIEHVKLGKEKLLKDRQNWIRTHLTYNSQLLEDEQKVFNILSEENIDINKNEVIGKSGSRLLIEDDIVLLFDSTIWYKIISSTDSIPTQKMYRTFNSNNDQISYQNYVLDEEDNWYINDEAAFEYNDDGQLINSNNKAIREGKLVTVSISKFTWKSELEGIEERYEYDDFTQQIEKKYRREFKYHSLSNPIEINIDYEYNSFYDFDANLQEYLGSLKDEYTYDDNNNLISRKHYYWSKQTTDWVLSDFIEYEIDNNGRLISTIESYSNALITNLKKRNKEVVNYDNNGNQILYGRYKWNESQQDWIGLQKSTSVYNDQNQVLSRIYFSWSSEKKKFIPTNKNTYNYTNEKQTLVENEVYDQIDESWNKNYKYIYAFDENGYNTKIEYYVGNNNNEWKLVSTDTSTYDEKGRLISKIDFREDEGYQFNISYDYTDDNMTKEIIQEWDQDLEKWVNQQQYYYTTIVKDNASTWMMSDWNNEKEQWEFNRRIDLTYDNDGNETSKKTYTGAIDNWEKNGYTTYEYDEYGSVTKKQEFKLMDNDWSNEAYSTDIFQFDYKGRILLEERIIPSNPDISYKFEYEYAPFKDYETVKIHLYGLPNNYTSGNKIEQKYYNSYMLYEYINNYKWDGKEWKGNYRHEYAYNDLDNFIFSKTLYNFDDEQNMTGNQYFYKYDTSGNTVHSLSQEFENKKWINVSEREYEYNENNNKILELSFSNWDDDKKEYTQGYRTTNVYNEDNDYIKTTTQKYNNGSWSNSNKKEYEYIDKNIFNITDYSYKEDYWLKNSLWEYKYDEELFIEKETYHNITYAGETEISTKTTERITYFASPKKRSRLKEYYKTLLNSSTNIHEICNQFETFRSTYNLKEEFDGYVTQDHSLFIKEDSVNNNLTSRTYYSNNGSYNSPNWVPIEKYEYENSNGVQSGITQYIYNGSTFDAVIKYNQTYSEEDEVYTFFKYEYKNGVFENKTKNEYQLDNENQYIFLATYHWDSTHEKWKGSLKKEYEQSANENWSSYAQYIWNYKSDEWIGEYKKVDKGNRIEYAEWDFNNKRWLFTHSETTTQKGEQTIYENDVWFKNEWIPNYKTTTSEISGKKVIETLRWINQKWNKSAKITSYKNVNGFIVTESAEGINGEWKNKSKVIEIKNMSVDTPKREGWLTETEYFYWIEQEWKEIEIIEILSGRVENFYIAFFEFDKAENKYLPSHKYDLSYKYTWNNELEDWLGIRSNSNTISNITKKWNNDTQQWELYERKSDFYSPVITFNIPESIPFNLTNPTYTLDIVTTAPGLSVTSSVESVEFDGLELKYKESGVVDLVISTPAGVTSDGTPYTARELNTSFTIEEALSIDDVVLESQIIAYPNPASDFVKIMAPSGTVISSIEVITNQGAKIDTINASIIDVRGYSNGIYFLRINTNKGIISKPFIVK
ncbi:T9SS type A sorting domain-containing protein [Flammeovirga sp. SJP92]|uniref:T9SS type A sorting domain-containing protein n=1 Tax=Flammeovirga sp. SJP92 TaxID=1775430 RepID=UPI00079A7044|nr:T9SS type A sorting domain-containing protein [Flammeovirga sp. SJP92]KXX68187.1 hypothetical protein AVL50_20535 [Flammeovirga sp. SJP92]